MKKLLLICILLGCFAGLDKVCAQEMSAKKYENPQWYNIVFIDYKPGMYDKAQKIIRDYFIKASEKAGTSGPSMVLVLHSGPFDQMALWSMEGGIEDMNWDVSPDNVKWRNALNDLAGGADKAGKIIEDYQACIASSRNAIGRVR